MSKFKRFDSFLEEKELMNAEDGLVGKDYSGTLSTKPPQEPSKGKTDQPLPYKNEPDDPTVWTAPDDDAKEPLGNKGTPGLTPKVSGGEEPPKAKQRPKPKKLTSEEFINLTKDMSGDEFFKYISEAHNTEICTVTDLFGNEFTPDPQQSVEYVVGLILNSPHYMEKFTREVKRRDGMQDLMSEMFQHNEGYDSVVNHLEDSDLGASRSGKLAKSINDRYMKVFDSLDESISPPLDQVMPQKPSSPKPQGGAIGGGFGPDSTPDPNYSNPDPNYSHGGGSGGGQPNVPNFGGGNLPPFVKKMKEDSPAKIRHGAGHYLINELSGFPHFKKHMIDRCKDC